MEDKDRLEHCSPISRFWDRFSSARTLNQSNVVLNSIENRKQL